MNITIYFKKGERYCIDDVINIFYDINLNEYRIKNVKGLYIFNTSQILEIKIK